MDGKLDRKSKLEIFDKKQNRLNMFGREETTQVKKLEDIGERGKIRKIPKQVKTIPTKQDIS